MGGTLSDVVEEGRRVLAGADDHGVTLRLLGGVAILLRSQNGLAEPFRRAYEDLDFAASRASAKACTGLLRELGYEPNVPFNALHGRQRLLFFDERHGRKADIFVGRFRMSHEIPLEGRLDLSP